MWAQREINFCYFGEKCRSCEGKCREKTGKTGTRGAVNPTGYRLQVQTGGARQLF